MKKRSFSLVEIFIAFALLALVAGFIGLQPLAFFESTRLRELKRLILRNIEQADQYALIAQAGITLTFTMKDGALLVSMKGERPPTERAKKLLELHDRLEKAPKIELVTHSDRRYEPPFSIVFYPGGESFEEKSSERIKCIEIIPHTSNGKVTTINTNLPEPAYVSKAPKNEALYPKLAL